MCIYKSLHKFERCAWIVRSMAMSGGGRPFIKKEDEHELDSNPNSISTVDNNNHIRAPQDNDGDSNDKGVTIAERRAAFSASNGAHFDGGGLSPAAGVGAEMFFTVPSGLSPSELLDTPVMLPNTQALSPTTGSYQFPSTIHDSLKMKLKLTSNGGSSSSMLTETCSDVDAPEPFEESEQNKTAIIRNQEISPDQTRAERSLQPNQERRASISKEATNNSHDGFYWRKYGQKQVKGSEFPRSYYRCTATNCPVTKKVERAHDGGVTEIVYNGRHNHSEPNPLKRFDEASGVGGGLVGSGSEVTEAAGKDVDDIDGMCSSFLDFSDHAGAGEFAPAASPESVGEEDENGECDSKKRKRVRESFPSETAVSRSGREPKVVVQVESEVDILEDGYRWRKYGQKVVKGNPNPRSYYKCTTVGCPVRKHVERAAHDKKFVMTTYEGKHSHEVPSIKNGNLILSDPSNLPPPLNNTTNTSTPPTMADKKSQDLPLYLDRKPVLDYNELMRSSLGSDINFSSSSYDPLRFPPFPSLPYAFTNNYPSSSLYTVSDYMPMPSTHAGASSNHNMTPLGGGYHYSANNYAAANHQPPSLGLDAGAVVPKEEQIMDEDEMYKSCISRNNQGNGAI